VTTGQPEHAARFRLVYTGWRWPYVIATRSPAATPQPAGAGWASFTPAGSANQQVQEIATRIGAEYRLSDGRQLVAVTPSFPPSYPVGSGSTLPITQYTVAYRTSASSAVNYTSVPSQASVMYQLCGLGPACSIAVGQPSVARFELLRRESLKHALCTFHHLGASTVVTFVPPAKGQKPRYAFLFSRAAFGAQLARPLTATLGAGPTPQASQLTLPEQAAVNRLTDPSLYGFSYTHGQDGGIWVVFAPPRSATAGGG